MTIKSFCFSWGMLLLGVLMNVFGVYAIKLKINTINVVQFDSFMAVVNYFITLAKFPAVILGAIAIMAAPFPYAIALSKMELSVAYPVSVVLNCLILLPVTVMLLGETVSWNKAIAVLLMVVSLFLFYR